MSVRIITYSLSGVLAVCVGELSQNLQLIAQKSLPSTDANADVRNGRAARKFVSFFFKLR